MEKMFFSPFVVANVLGLTLVFDLLSYLLSEQDRSVITEVSCGAQVKADIYLTVGNVNKVTTGIAGFW
jgi:hypothetical protein